MDKMAETYHSPSWHLDLKDNEIRNLRARVAELEAEVKDLKPYRYLHPGTPEDLNRYREALVDILANEEAYSRGDALSAHIARSVLEMECER